MSNKVIDVHIPDITEILTLFYSEETNLVENLQFSWEGTFVFQLPIPLASVIEKSSSLSISSEIFLQKSYFGSIVGFDL